MKTTVLLATITAELLATAALLISIFLPKRRIWPPVREGSPRRFFMLILFLISGAGVIYLGIAGWGGFIVPGWARIVIGIPAWLAGNIIGLWAMAALGAAATVGAQGKLLRRGPYAFSRNPQYLGFLLALAGWAVMSNCAAAFAASLAGIIPLGLAPLAEEPWLLERLGPAYENYRREVPRFGSVLLLGRTLSRSRGMLNTPQLAARFLGVAIFDTARLAARSFIFPGRGKSGSRKEGPLNIAFFASHRGSNMQAVIEACKTGRLNARPCAVISNNGDSEALEKAKQEGIPHYHLSAKTHPDPDRLDEEILGVLENRRANWIVLAGYMKKLGPKVLEKYKGRILNVHPSLLPKYGGKGMCGAAVHAAVLAAGEKETGVTIHLVDEQYDHGKILAQHPVPVLPGDTVESLSGRVLEREHVVLVETLNRIITGEIPLAEEKGE
jgi:phosphoribosylglycinamide formyltransferase-1